MKINIDGKNVIGYKGQTILDVARANGIEIPTLCYDDRVKIYGACGLCVVETANSPKLLRACATEISPGMVVYTNTPRIRESRKLTLELLLSDHVGDCKGPCSKACPAHTDVQGYVGLIANGKIKEAVEVVKRQIPLPASIGRVCPHPCEDACRRQLVEDPIAIANLKHYAADLDLNSDEPYLPEAKPATGKKVAVIGAGPAGLTAAYYLALEGHAITVYDAMPEGGGMLRYGIPEYRLPKDTLQKEIDLIEKLGVKFVYNTKIGVDVSLDYLRDHNDAVFVGIGAWESSPMRCKGEDLPGVLGGIDFLREVATFGNVQIGDTVAVVGGGNTAMDACRTAIRLGAKKVMILYRRTRAEMPAEDIEIKEAEEEGVEFKFLVAPIEITASNGKINAVRVQQMELGEPDASGRRKPVPIEGAEEVIPVDTIISAIGQKVKPDGLEEVGISKWGTIAADDTTLVTNIPGVFAGGDGVTGPKIAVDAIAQGRVAADSMIKYLNGEAITYKEPYTVEQKGLTSDDFADYEKIARVKMPTLAPAERRNNFREVTLGLATEDAVAEANRCLECGCRDYYECKLIKYANQYDVQPERVEGSTREEKLKEVYPFFERNSEKCILCGLCLRVCEEVMGVTVLGLVHRGFESIVQPEFNLPLNETECLGCGQCVTVCPTGALMERLPVTKNVPLEMPESETVCSFCSMGCEQVINTCGDTAMRALPPEGKVLCQRGRFAFEAYDYERLTKPMVKRDGAFVETSWREAYKAITRAAQKTVAKEGKNSLAMFISPSYSLEETKAAVELGCKGFETDKLSSFTPNSCAPIAQVFGKYTATGSVDEIDSTDLILMVGSLNESQIAAVKVRKAVENGAKLIVIASEPSTVDNIATVKINPENGIDVLKQILAAVVNQKLVDEKFISAKVSGYGELKHVLSSVTPDCSTEKIADMFGKARNAMIVADGHTVTAAGIELLADLALVTGKVGKVRNGLVVVTPGSNQTGLWQLGATACTNCLTEMVKDSSIKGIFVLGEDPVGAGVLTIEDLNGLDLKVAVTPYMTKTAELADVILPGSTPFETAGTYLTADGQTKSFAQVKAPAAGLNNLDIIKGLADAMQIKADFSTDAAKLAAEITSEEIKAQLVIPQDGKLFTAAVTCNPALIKFKEKH